MDGESIKMGDEDTTLDFSCNIETITDESYDLGKLLDELENDLISRSSSFGLDTSCDIVAPRWYIQWLCQNRPVSVPNDSTPC